jgi:cysteine synthase
MSSRTVSSVLELIGDTPLIHLRKAASGLERDIFAKLELRNPGGSIKDRAAMAMIRAAEEAGFIRPGDTLIEPTAGNTGIGLALVGSQMGYQVILVVPEKFSREKVLLMEALGGRVIRTPTSEGMEGAIRKSRELRENLPRAFIPQQFENPANPQVHYDDTGREIIEDMKGRRIDALVIGSGTGGTFSGVARRVKEAHPGALAYIVEPVGSILGGGARAPYEVEGIGASFYPRTLRWEHADGVITVRDEDSLRMVAHLARTEGLLLGGSSGANYWAAAEVARSLPKNSAVMTVFPDAAERYLSKNILRYVPAGGNGGGGSD